MRAVIYARVSSKEQEREGYSIEAQLELCRALASKRKLQVVREFIDVESAKQAGRTNFGEMIEYVREEAVDTIICHKVDRLCRNFRDFVTIDDLGIPPIFVEEEFADNASGKLTYGLKVLLAKHYVDNLSDEVKKGMKQKLARGEWGHLAPYGYRNTGPRGTIQVEPAEAANVLYMFKTFATGAYSLQGLRAKFKADDLVYKDRHRVPSKGYLDRILKNPIYFGVLRIKGELYPGNHEPRVSRELFEKVQAVFRAANKPKKTKRDFTYAGMMTCSVCGCAITAEIHKGKYTYYHCTGNRGGCEPQFVREEVLNRQFEEAVRRLDIDAAYFDLILQTLTAVGKGEMELRAKALDQLRKRKETLRKRIDQAYMDKLDGVITEELWLEKSRQWTSEAREIEDKIRFRERSGASWLEKGTRIIELARKAYPSYLHRNPTQKRRMLQILCSNYSLNGCNLHYSYKEPFNLLVEGSHSANWSG
jgi:DNA invertase Pin-like site-specific DNA recombinase